MNHYSLNLYILEKSSTDSYKNYSDDNLSFAGSRNFDGISYILDKFGIYIK